ncbi:unnamed protein product [Rotaria sp. Silwood1]|nr:unnamed protein product [Rotaria sp. Silwood1]CAF1153193.1 unnamed protein product [Rotaria sp. Silwood1]
MNDILHIVKTTSQIKNGSWVRVEHGIYPDDLAKVEYCDMIQNMVTFKLIPRIDYTKKTRLSSILIIALIKSYENVTYRKELVEQVDEKTQNDIMKVSNEFFLLLLLIQQEIVGSKDYSYHYNGLNDENLSHGYDQLSSSILLPDLKESFSIGLEHEEKIR